MSVTLTEPVMGRKKGKPTGRVELRAELEWIARLERQASRLGIGISAYVRQAVSLRLEQDEASDPQTRRGRKEGGK
jgi:hypothetical protein